MGHTGLGGRPVALGVGFASPIASCPAASGKDLAPGQNQPGRDHIHPRVGETATVRRGASNLGARHPFGRTTIAPATTGRGASSQTTSWGIAKDFANPTPVIKSFIDTPLRSGSSYKKEGPLMKI